MIDKVWKTLKTGPHSGRQWTVGEFVLLPEADAKYIRDAGWIEAGDALEYQAYLDKLGQSSVTITDDVSGAKQLIGVPVEEAMNAAKKAHTASETALKANKKTQDMAEQLVSMIDMLKTEMADMKTAYSASTSEAEKTIDQVKSAVNQVDGLADKINGFESQLQKIHDGRDKIISAIEASEEKIAALTPTECDKINAEYLRRINGTFKCIIGSSEYEFDGGNNLSAIDRNMTLAFQANTEGVPGGDLSWHVNLDVFTWPDINGNDIPMDVEEMTVLGKAAAAFQDNLTRASWKLRALDTLPDDYTSDRHWL